MRQTYVLTQISKLNQLEMSIDEYNKKANEWVKQITVFDHPEFLKHNKPKVEIEEREEAGLNEEAEYYKGRNSLDFSLDNWRRFKKGLPVLLPKVFLPKRLDKRNSIKLYGRKLYIVKKTENFTPTSLFCVFDVKTGVYICAGWDKHTIEKFLIENLPDKLDIILKEEK